MLKKNVQEKQATKQWKGLVTFTTYNMENACEEARDIDEYLHSANDIEWSQFERLSNRLKELCTFKEQAFNNRIVSVGRQCFTGRLIGETTYTGAINYGSLGTSSTAVNDSDTQLVAEVKRKAVATKTRVTNTATFRFYYSKADITGTFQEFATFIDGTSTANSGQMFNRVLTGGWTKSSLESLTVTVQFDLNAA